AQPGATSFDADGFGDDATVTVCGPDAGATVTIRDLVGVIESVTVDTSACDRISNMTPASSDAICDRSVPGCSWGVG
ncbi:MAG: hypothetical protein U9R51_03375, partial [Actinomycetota bacterium]|nr:hypothetical protein [Actinomycetota bacterium]